ncbi:MAG: lactonase family protein [Verrucomicrobiota bacterium]|nr:lactonase family protein [Verrucomicrobiota bacterium]
MRSILLFRRIIFVFCFWIFVLNIHSAPKDLLVYIGTYTKTEEQGIHWLKLDMATGKLTAVGKLAGQKNPSFLTIHSNKKFLYAVNEIGNYKGEKAGGVSAYSIDSETGALTFLNQQSSKGGAPCHLVVDATGRNVLVANYTGGSVVSLPISRKGRLRKAASFIQHEGSSVLKPRQAAPHGHSINVSPGNKFAVAADLGLDKVLVYGFEPKGGKLTPAGFAKVAPGAGPRHFAFHPNGKFAYVINEITLTVTAFTWDEAKGKLTELQTITTLPVERGKGMSTAEVQVHPSGKFLYGSNRGHNTIAVFNIDQKTGKLKVVQHQSTLGKTPRNFGIDPTGKFLVAANQSSGDIFTFQINQATGELKATGHKIEVPTPVCVKFLNLGGK